MSASSMTAVVFMLSAVLMVGTAGLVPDAYGAAPTPKACESFKKKIQMTVELGILSEEQAKMVLKEVGCA